MGDGTQPTPLLCPYCGKPTLGEPTVADIDGDRMHIWCAAEEMDGLYLDRDMGDS